MKTLKLFILFVLFFHHVACYSQEIEMNKEVEEIVSLGKAAIVQLALDLLDNSLSAEHFTKIEVVTDGEEVYVTLRNPVKYLPISTEYYFDGLVHIVAQTTAYGAVSNGSIEKEAVVAWYKPHEEALGHIAFVVEAINNSKLVGAIDQATFEDDLIIREQESFYEVLVVSELQESSYKVKRGTGNIYDALHAPLVPAPFESDHKDPLMVIK